MENQIESARIPSEDEAKKYAKGRYPDNPRAQELQIKAALRTITKEEDQELYNLGIEEDKKDKRIK